METLLCHADAFGKDLAPEAAASLYCDYPSNGCIFIFYALVHYPKISQNSILVFHPDMNGILVKVIQFHIGAMLLHDKNGNSQF